MWKKPANFLTFFVRCYPPGSVLPSSTVLFTIQNNNLCLYGILSTTGKGTLSYNMIKYLHKKKKTKKIVL